MSVPRRVARRMLGGAMMSVWVLLPALPIVGLLLSRIVGVR